MKAATVVVIALAVAVVAGCSPTPKPKQQAEPTKFDELGVSEIVPTIDGGAYVATIEGLFYVRGNQAVRVREVSAITNQPAVASPTQREQYWQSLYQQQRTKNRSRPGSDVDRADPRPKDDPR